MLSRQSSRHRHVVTVISDSCASAHDPTIQEIAMLAIQGLKCIYDTTGRGWAMEIALEGDNATRRFDLDGPDDAEMLIEAFEDSSASHFDPMTGEIAFAYEYAEVSHDDEDDAEDEDTSEDQVAGDDDGDDDNEDDTTRKVA
jgi:DNA-directed RNA polymerase subunit delta